MFKLIILAGFSCAGKSTLAREFSSKYNYEFVEHQALIHSIANKKGFDRARFWLKEVGLLSFIKESTSEMIKEIKNSRHKNTKDIITDVSYGVDMLDEIQNNIPDVQLILVSVAANKETRGKRILKRMGNPEKQIGEEELRFRDKFLKDCGLETVLRNCDIYVKNDKNISLVAYELYNKIQHYD